MTEGHRLVQMSSHVTSVVGRVGVVGLCSCGWLAGEEGEDTRMAVNKLHEAWETHERKADPATAAMWPNRPAPHRAEDQSA